LINYSTKSKLGPLRFTNLAFCQRTFCLWVDKCQVGLEEQRWASLGKGMGSILSDPLCKVNFRISEWIWLFVIDKMTNWLNDLAPESELNWTFCHIVYLTWIMSKIDVAPVSLGVKISGLYFKRFTIINLRS
jgi:hypothetical protein